jgi:hypothetical protein
MSGLSASLPVPELEARLRKLQEERGHIESSARALAAEILTLNERAARAKTSSNLYASLHHSLLAAFERRSSALGPRTHLHHSQLPPSTFLAAPPASLPQQLLAPPPAPLPPDAALNLRSVAERVAAQSSALLLCAAVSLCRGAAHPPPRPRIFPPPATSLAAASWMCSRAPRASSRTLRARSTT